MNSNNSGKIVSGVLLMLLGVLFLGKEFGWLYVSWGQIWKFWPLVIIFWGLTMTFGKSDRTASVFGIILLAIAIPMGIISNVVHKVKDHVSDFNIESHHDYDNEDVSGDGKDANSANFSEDIDPSIKTATFHLNGGAVVFNVGDGTAKLLEGNADVINNHFNLRKSINNSHADVYFEMKKGKNGTIELDNDSFDGNQVDIKLNTTPEWSMEVELGAGKADLDLSNFNLKNLSLKTGVTTTDIKIGDKAIESHISVESGVADIEIEVPEGVGCLIKTEKEALNIKDFDGFVKNGDSYTTSNYEKATKKIVIEFKSGLSNLKVKRY